MDEETKPTPAATSDLLMSPAIDKLSAAMVALQRGLKPVTKATQNPFFGSMYASLPDCINSLLPQMGEQELALMQFPADAGPGRAALITLVLHSSGQYLGCKAGCGVSKNDPQAAGSAITYLRRYSLAALGLVTEADDDGNGASGPPSTRPAPTARPVPAAPAPQRAVAPRPTVAPRPPARPGPVAAIDPGDDFND
ncbi:MAG: ERF family protein [Chloroflexales bacterium]